MAVAEAPAKLPGVTDHDKLISLCQLPYSQQAVWFLNAFWGKYGDRAEDLWNWVETFTKLDNANGCGVDELVAHRFLEKHQETSTVLEMRNALRKSGALEQNERPKLVPLTHFLLTKLDVDWHLLVNATQGDQSKIQEARRMLEEVQKALDAALEAEAPFKAAQEEVEAALAEVKKQEDEYHGKIADAEKRSKEGGAVTRGRAANELAQLKAEDPLPLRKAKITLEAAQKRAEKARAPLLAAREEVEKRFEEAEAYLKEVSAGGGESSGQVWWLERTLHEKRKFMPVSKGGVR